MTTDASRLQHIDSLRAVAALLVVWLHGSELFAQVAPAIGSRWIADGAKMIDVGRVGVVIFFGISGFLIPSSLHGSGWPALRDFAAKRFFRLFPLFWLSIPLALLTMWLPFGRVMDAREIALNLTMMPGWLGATPAMGLYWTLQIELLFYALCAGLFALGVVRRPFALAACAGACTGLFVVAFLLAKWRFASLDPLLWLNLAVMFVGAVWRRRMDEGLPRLETAILAATVLAIVLIPAGSFALYLVKPANDLSTFLAFAAHALGLCLFLVFSAFSVLRSAVLSWLGMISYSIYLLHPVVLYPMVWALKQAPERAPDMSLLMAFAVAATIALSALTFYGVERPAIRLGRRLLRERAAPSQPLASPAAP